MKLQDLVSKCMFVFDSRFDNKFGKWKPKTLHWSKSLGLDEFSLLQNFLYDREPNNLITVYVSISGVETLVLAFTRDVWGSNH